MHYQKDFYFILCWYYVFQCSGMFLKEKRKYFSQSNFTWYMIIKYVSTDNSSQNETWYEKFYWHRNFMFYIVRIAFESMFEIIFTEKCLWWYIFLDIYFSMLFIFRGYVSCVLGALCWLLGGVDVMPRKKDDISMLPMRITWWEEN